MTRTRLSLLALLCCQTALSGIAMAQDTTELDMIVVEGAGSATGPVDSADPLTLTGAKSATPLSEVPQSVSVISSEALKAGNVSKLDGALDYTAGVIGQPYGYDSDTNWIMIRGFAATATGSFQDGLPNYSYAFGGFYIDPLLVERIEVLKGASSVLYGGSNPGGLVNYVSKEPTGETSTEVETGADDSGQVWISLDQNGKLSANTDYRLLGKLERIDGHGAFDDGVHGVLSGSLRHRLEGGAELTFGLDYMKVNEKHVGNAWLPYEGTVTRAPFGRIDRDFNSGEPDHDRYKRDQVAVRATWQQDLGGWHFTNNSRIAWSRVEEDSVYAYGYSGFALSPVDERGTMARLVFDHSTDTTTVLNDSRLETSVEAFGAEHRLMIGLDLKYFRLDQMQASATGTPLTFVGPDYGADQPDAVPYIDQVLTQRQAGLYLQDQIRWGDGWIATGNLRYDLVKTETGTNHATGDEGSERSDGEASWRLGLARTLANGVTPYVSASTYFNPQVVNDAAGGAISPETGRQIEAGVKWSLSDRFLLTAAVFDLRRENISQSVYDWDAGGYVYQQIGKVRSRGIEFEAQGDLGSGLMLNAELTKMEIEVRDDADTTIIGKTPYSLPEETAALKLAWTPEAAPDWTFTGGVRYVGSSWADNANTLKVPGRTLYDLGVSHRFSGGWEANLMLNNLFDKTYVASCQTAYWCYYGEERTASLSLRKRF